MENIFKTEEVNQSHRFQYSLEEAARMLCCSPNTAKKWCAEFLYKIDGVGVNFIRHDNLVSVVEDRAVMNSFASSCYGGLNDGVN